MLRKLLVLAALAAPLAGCSTIQGIENDIMTTFTLATGQTISPQAVIIAANGFDAIEITATNYLNLPTCNGSAVTVCKTPATVVTLVTAIRAGRAARNQLEGYMTANPGVPAPISPYNVLITAINTLQGIVGPLPQ
jgi:predicted small secreted protein